MRYVSRRLLSGVVLLLLISVLIFALAEVAPGDFLSRLELDSGLSPEDIESLRQRHGLSGGVARRYFSWISSVVSGEFGYSLTYGISVGDLLLPRARNTLLLTVLASTISWALALALGTWGAWREGGWIDRFTLGANAVLLALPQLLLGLGCLFWAAWSGLFPLGGMTSLDFEDLGPMGRVLDLAWHLALPVTALVLGSLPVLTSHVRAALLEVKQAGFLRAARGHGLSPTRLLLAHALPAAANPLISLFGFSLASLLSGAVLIEVVLDWPGMGRLLIEAIGKRDLHVVLGATLLSAVFVILGQLVADLLLHAADPRIREPR